MKRKVNEMEEIYFQIFDLDFLSFSFEFEIKDETKWKF
jgi:hypothetical protein